MIAQAMRAVLLVTAIATRPAFWRAAWRKALDSFLGRRRLDVRMVRLDDQLYIQRVSAGPGRCAPVQDAESAATQGFDPKKQRRFHALRNQLRPIRSFRRRRLPTSEPIRG